MKKAIFVFVFAVLFSITANAEIEVDTDELGNTLSNSTYQTLDSFGVNTLEDVKNADLLSGITDIIKSNVSEPIKLFALLVGISILGSLYNLLSSSKNENFTLTAGMLCAGTVVTTGIADKIQQISIMLNEGATFISSFVPIMTSIMVASGYVVTASAYNILLIFASNVAIYSSSGAITTLLGCYLAVCLVSGINSEINLNGLSNGLKKIAIWGLGIISTLFVAILSIQGIAGKAADSVAMKTAKFALSSTIPIVGSALSDAISSVEGSIGILRATVGTFGIIAGLAIVLPTVVNIVLTKVAIEGAAIIAEMLGTKKISELYKNLGAVITVLIALTAFFFLVLLVSVTVVMVICN